LALGSWLLALGSWLLALGSWLLALGSWLLALGSWLLALGSWLKKFILFLLSWQDLKAFFLLFLHHYEIFPGHYRLSILIFLLSLKE